MTSVVGPEVRSASDRVLWVSWAVLFFLTATWVVANPLMASPDEPAHVVRAAAVVRGEWTGPDVQGGTQVEVPYYYNLTTGYPTCYMFRPEVTAVCNPPVTQDLDNVAAAVTPAGRYNPLYYLLVGTPTLLPSGDGVLYAMRLLSAALCTFFLALGFRALASTPRPGWAVLGPAGAVTPMVVFLSSTVNPAAIEIAAAFSLWCQLLTLLRHPDPALVARRMRWIALTSVLLVNARGLSLLYCAVIVGVVLVVSPWRNLVDVIRARSTWPSFAVIVAGCGAALGWILGTNSLGSGGAVLDAGLGFKSAAVRTIADTNSYVTNMVGQFGWMDTNLATWVHMSYAAVLGLVVLVAMAVATWRERAGILLVAAATLAIPVVVQGSQAKYLGIVWQGRYMLPVAVGVALVAAYVTVSRTAALPSELGPRLADMAAIGAAWVLSAASADNLHRYVNGESGPWRSLAPDAWVPPLPVPLVAGLALAAVVAYALLIHWVARRPGHPDLTSVTPAHAGAASSFDRPPAPTS